MAKQLSFSNESREALEKGVNFVANAVKVTIGPKAKNVVIERKFGSPDIVRDGSTVAKEIEIENPISNLGAKLIEQVASKTKESAGDGTTTATNSNYFDSEDGSGGVKKYCFWCQSYGVKKRYGGRPSFCFRKIKFQKYFIK